MRATVRMPGALSVEEKALPGGYTFPVVSFDGISHVIAGASLERDEAEKHIREWCEYLGADALGIMILDEAAYRLSPLVYVPSAGTMFWENSCASGTSAVGAYLRERQGEVRVSLAQPGGTLTIEARKDGELLLTGTVRELSRGSIAADI